MRYFVNPGQQISDSGKTLKPGDEFVSDIQSQIDNLLSIGVINAIDDVKLNTPAPDTKNTSNTTEVKSLEEMTVKELNELMVKKGIPQTRGESKNDKIIKLQNIEPEKEKEIKSTEESEIGENTESSLKEPEEEQEI